MHILGISEIDNDAGVVLLKDSAVVCGINEERLSRIKQHAGFPHRSVEWVLRYAGLTLNDIDWIAVAKADPSVNPELFYRVRERLSTYDYFSKADPASLWTKTLNWMVQKFRNAPRSVRVAGKMSDEIRDWGQKNSCLDKMIRVPHHYAHAACAYWAGGYDNALAVTIDGQGEGITSQVYLVTKGGFDLLKEIFVPHSLGVFYAAVTKALGFRPARHEGKITGLAAYGKPDEKLLSEIRKLASYDGKGGFVAPSIYGNYPKILYLAKQYGRENISAAFQTVLEEVATQYISYYVKTYKTENIVLAGGVFANVKLNQRTHGIPGVKNVFVFPHMADGGLGYGAAQIVYRDKTQDLKPSPIRDVYWGPEYTEQEIEQSLKKYGLDYSRMEDPASTIAELLTQNKVVAHFDGRMEFGPRALGNRSILYPATDPKVNDWLNHQLNRSEFMPFAPVTLAEEARRCYPGLAGAEYTAQFMTITFDCTDSMKKQSPAVVHVDGTARPQLISESINPRYYRILKEYFKRTGIPSVVNTSFNMHEEPIVCSPEDAIRAFLQGGLDYLAIGNFLVARVEAGKPSKQCATDKACCGSAGN
ncbi:MAG: carbamoyltransferase C-terminal domain-containing protein [Patescibacteria group bacterium]|jgi:carbamoyltransferase